MSTARRKTGTKASKKTTTRTKPARPARASRAATEARPERPGQQLLPSYFHGQSFPSELLRRFFVAALGFREVEPWLMFGAEEWLDLDIPQLGIAGAAVSIITDDGCGGLQIFPDRGALERLMRDDAASPAAGGVMAVMFYTRGQLPDSLREELRRLAFAPAIGMIPALAVRDEHALVRPLARRDYMQAIAVLEAVAELVEGLAGSEDSALPAAFEHTVTVLGEAVTVRLRLPAMQTRRVDAPVLGPGIRGQGPRPAENSVHVLKVTLRDSRPPIWRRLEVPSTITLGALHDVLQVAMGWEDEHLHMFNVKGQEIGPIEHDAEYDEYATELWAVAPAARARLRYTYDFGDDWVHDIEVERVYAAEQPLAAPRCIDGRRAGPPEDCGGIGGLDDLLAGGPPDGHLDDDDDDDDYAAEGEDEDIEDDEEIEVRPPYDPAAFSIDEVNKILARRYLSASAMDVATAEE